MSKRKKSDEFEQYPFAEEHRYIIRPQVFGARNKFGELDDNGKVRKVDGRYRHQAGETATLRSTAYWALIHAIMRELNMTNRDRFIFEGHADGLTAKQINQALKASPYFKPYQKSEYVNDRIGALIRKYFLTVF